MSRYAYDSLRGCELQSVYYVDGQVATQEQEEKTIGYDYDPSGRTEETETIVKGKPESTTIDHYSGPGEALAWTSEGGEQWTRNIPGIDGELDAIQTSGGATTLQLHDLQGNIVATAALSETETKLLSTYNSTEFGVPSEGKAPPKYSWLGGGVSTELASGVATAGGSSYVPEIGRPLQTGPIASPGSFPDGTASVGVIEAPYLGAASAQLMVLAAQEGAAREEAKRIEAEERAFNEEGTCEKYPDSSECHVDGPGEGNCEVNCLTEELEIIDPQESMLLTPAQTLTFAQEMRKKAGNAKLEGIILSFLPAVGDIMGGTAAGISIYYEAIAHNLEVCALVADRCYVTVHFDYVGPWTIITSVGQEPCYEFGNKKFLCEPSTTDRSG